jgi:hypothetical protein
MYTYIHTYTCIYPHTEGGVGYFSNEHRFSVEYILQGISLNSSLWKRNDSSVVIKRDPDAANMRPALEQGCGKQMLSARKLFSWTNLLYVLDNKMYRRLRSRSVHFFVTCEKRTAAQWRLPEKEMFRPQEKSGFGIAQRFWFRKYSKSAQTWISVSSKFWY